jgi:hypothetical protein
MDSVDKIAEGEKLTAIDDIFEETMQRLKELHNEKLELIKKFRAENNLIELNKIRESIKE